MTSQLYDVATSNIIQAADIDQSVDALNILLGFTQSIIVNGSTTGTATLYQPLQGILKMVVVAFNNYRNGNSGDQTIALPTAFVRGAQGWNGDSGTFDLKSAGSNITVQVHSGFASGSADGAVTPTPNIRQNNQWHCGVFDTIGLWGSDGATHNGFIVIIGS